MKTMKYTKEDLFIGLVFSIDYYTYKITKLSEEISFENIQTVSNFNYNYETMLNFLNEGVWKILNPKPRDYEIY